MEVRAARVRVKAPEEKRGAVPFVDVNAILIREPDPPSGEPGVEWLLLTDLPIGSKAEIEAVIELYTRRWQIELYFHTLKSGCRVEERQLETDHNLLALIAMYMIVAWHVEYLTNLARMAPDLSCATVLDDDEWRAAYALNEMEPPPTTPPPLRVILARIAALGGFHPTKANPHPGSKSVWIGLQRIKDVAFGCRLAKRLAL